MSKEFTQIVDVVRNKASIKQKIYRNTKEAFDTFKHCTSLLTSDLEKEATQFDEGVQLGFSEKGEFEFQIMIGGDIIMFQMHTNVFDFDRSHAIWKTSYVKEAPERSYCGMINIFNFLSDSLKYDRYDDTAYLIGRVFINMEKHFFVEGKRQLNFIHNDFVNETIDQLCARNTVEQAILYSMGFDLFTPPFQHVQEISVGQLLNDVSGMRQKTGKRMGYRFSFED
jgi:hypothetical protein